MKELLLSTVFFVVSMFSFGQDPEIKGEANQVVTEIKSGWNGSKWGYNDKKTFTYNDNGFLESEFLEQWNEAWTKNYKTHYKYNEQGKLIEEHNLRYMDGSWDNKYQYKFTWEYDKEGIKVGGIDHRYNKKDGWHDFQKYTFTYDKKSQLLEELVENIDGNALTNRTKYKYSYDEENRLIEKLELSWYRGKSKWVNRERKSFKFHIIGKINNETLEKYNNEKWELEYSKSMTYDRRKVCVIVNSFSDRNGNNVVYYEYDEQLRLTQKIENYIQGSKELKDSKTEISYLK